ncbi:hypothetical protein CPB85DRAFT_1346772 [Mucidula mucida]|nr:hypothetical protein CPB85DRAFT_1346772 [Mucidula mucida]
MVCIKNTSQFRRLRRLRSVGRLLVILDSGVLGATGNWWIVRGTLATTSWEMESSVDFDGPGANSAGVLVSVQGPRRARRLVIANVECG